MNNLKLINNELPDKKIILVGRRAGMTVNVGTIGHIDHGKKDISVLDLLVFSASPEIPVRYLKPEKLEQPYYRRFEWKGGRSYNALLTGHLYGV